MAIFFLAPIAAQLPSPPRDQAEMGGDAARPPGIFLLL